MLLVAERSGLKRRLARLSASPNALPEQEYRFLVGRFIDSATLARATATAARWGVHPHEVMIANGWLGAEDYYRALAEACGTPFKTELTPRDVTPAAGAGPRRSLASGLLKERASSLRFVLAPDRLRPNALREMLARLKPHDFSLASPQSVRGAICRLMAWDPFNVTEDADLGMRLVRSGYRCAMIPSTTYEEAPRHLMSWLRQRTRWLKGYVQTWLVHMRSPRQLWRELGPLGFLGFQTVVGGTILSALVHPWFYVLAGLDLAQGSCSHGQKLFLVGLSGYSPGSTW